MTRSPALLVAGFAAASLAAPTRALPAPAEPAREVRILAFSDYHSHAVPFLSEGRPGQGGIARAIAFIEEERARPGTLVLSGGDMLNRGAPSWSDAFGCVEWPWLDGLVDAMALGNHDLDYGPEAFATCRASVRFPILSANLVGADGRPVLTVGGKPYMVKTVGGLRIGLFAVAGPDFARLVRPANLPPGARFTDPTAAARAVVRALRKDEHVAAVVLIGHEAREHDEALARAVPGIDVVLGTHSHHKGPLTTIPGTRTAYIAPYQYLAYVSRVTLAFRGGRLADVRGDLVPMDASREEDPAVAARVAELQARLRAERPERFRMVGRAEGAISDENVSFGESSIGNWATEVLRRAANAHACLVTASSFRGGLPAGEITAEDFYTAVPYHNLVVVADLAGRDVLRLLETSLARRGSDAFSQESGIRYAVVDGGPASVTILRDPAHPEAGFATIDPDARYRIATSDYQASTVAPYREVFARAAAVETTGLDVQDLLLAALASGPPTGGLDGRTGER